MAEYVHVTFRVLGDDLDPTTVTEALGLLPNNQHIKGATLAGKAERKALTGFWGLDSLLADDVPLEAHLTALVDRLTPYRNVIRELAAHGFATELYCTYIADQSHATVDLSADLLAGIGYIGVRLLIAAYFVDDGVTPSSKDEHIE